MREPKEGDILNVNGIRVIFVRHTPEDGHPCDDCVLWSMCVAGTKGFLCESYLKPVPVEDLI